MPSDAPHDMTVRNRRHSPPERGGQTAAISRLRELRRERVYASYREAAADPAYVKDMDAVTAAFDTTVPDGLGEKDG